MNGRGRAQGRWGVALLVLVLVLTMACASAPPLKANEQAVADSRFETEDGVSLWMREAGQRTGVPVVYLHGGPGYNAFDFEHSAGTLLERGLRMVYLDQRGCGRSSDPRDPRGLGLGPTVEDLERVRRKLGVPKLSLIAHSFGGVVAQAYVRAHPEHVAQVIFVDAPHHPEDALAHQVQVLVALGHRSGPAVDAAISRLERADKPAIEKLLAAYRVFPEASTIQGALYFSSDAWRVRHEALDARSGLQQRNSLPVAQAYQADGSMTQPLAHRDEPLPVPAVLFAGRKSEALGAAEVMATAHAWNIPVVWFEESGHFVYFEESSRFASEALKFLGGT